MAVSATTVSNAPATTAASHSTGKVAGGAAAFLVALPRDAPWLVIGRIGDLVLDLLGSLPPEFERISAGVAVHRSATVASSALVTGPVILSARCRVGHGAVLRGGVWAGEEVTIGPHSEIKGSLLLARSAAAHRNYVGDSMLGRDVNLEAGAVLANHFNERRDKQIRVRVDGQVITTGLTYQAVDTTVCGGEPGSAVKRARSSRPNRSQLTSKWSPLRSLLSI